MTQIVTHYHVGIRHYTATEPYVVAACGGKTSKAEEQAASITRNLL